MNKEYTMTYEEERREKRDSETRPSLSRRARAHRRGTSGDHSSWKGGCIFFSGLCTVPGRHRFETPPLQAS